MGCGYVFSVKRKKAYDIDMAGAIQETKRVSLFWVGST